MNVPIYAIITIVTGCISIGFIIGAYGNRFCTRAEFKEAVNHLHKRIDEILKIVQKIEIDLASIK